MLTILENGEVTKKIDGVISDIEIKGIDNKKDIQVKIDDVWLYLGRINHVAMDGVNINQEIFDEIKKIIDMYECKIECDKYGSSILNIRVGTGKMDATFRMMSMYKTVLECIADKSKLQEIIDNPRMGDDYKETIKEGMREIVKLRISRLKKKENDLKEEIKRLRENIRNYKKYSL